MLLAPNVSTGMWGGAERESARGNAQNCMCATGLCIRRIKRARAQETEGRELAIQVHVLVAVRVCVCVCVYSCVRIRWCLCVCVCVSLCVQGEGEQESEPERSQVCLPTIDIDSQLFLQHEHRVHWKSQGVREGGMLVENFKKKMKKCTQWWSDDFACCWEVGWVGYGVRW